MPDSSPGGQLDASDPQAVFEDPSAYLGLPGLNPSARILRVWSDCAFTNPVSYTLYPRDQRLLVRRVVLVPGAYLAEPQPWGADALLPVAEVRDLLTELRGLTLPVFAASDMLGRDGCTHGIEVFGAERQARLTWWESPAGWEALTGWHSRAIERFARALPAHTPTSG